MDFSATDIKVLGLKLYHCSDQRKNNLNLLCSTVAFFIMTKVGEGGREEEGERRGKHNLQTTHYNNSHRHIFPFHVDHQCTCNHIHWVGDCCTDVSFLSYLVHRSQNTLTKASKHPKCHQQVLELKEAFFIKISLIRLICR